MEYKDYYSILGVPRTATDEEIKKAFRKLARQFHPDIAKDKKRAEERFKDINEAYEVLSRPENRKKYDMLGAEWKNPVFQTQHKSRNTSPGNTQSFVFNGTGFSEFFERFFGRNNPWENASSIFDSHLNDDSDISMSASRKGNNLQGDVMVTLNEVMQGSIRTVTVQTDSTSGITETFKVRIPSGVQDGQLVRIAGKGETGDSGGKSGDLFLRVRYARHPDFQTDKSNLIYELNLAPWEAVLGANVEIPSLDGKKFTIKVPPGTSQGQQLRLKGKGLPTGESSGRGDLYASIVIKMPKQISAVEKNLWDQLSKVSTFNPRK